MSMKETTGFLYVLERETERKNNFLLCLPPKEKESEMVSEVKKSPRSSLILAGFRFQ